MPSATIVPVGLVNILAFGTIVNIGWNAVLNPGSTQFPTCVLIVNVISPVPSVTAVPPGINANWKVVGVTFTR